VTNSSSAEPRNPLYLLLLLASLVFVLTALAYAIIPTLEEKAADAGAPPPPSAARDALRKDGWKWLLVEVAVVIVLGLASMWLDHHRLRQRSLQKDRPPLTISPRTTEVMPLTPPETVPHEPDPRTTDRPPAPPD
jgi:hypothetical protein